ncbi:DUF1127 domain-containing protein [Nitratireductor sp. ZSWI3]|uniref:DUF1127 domain-containing protein n=1 Tax=Nitratireductor sp. ZSWI3 TaxID=2966359 RepID=UPI0021500D17|nr:DUF1127 domain-containing protein [Nitratireductor sp. ZSWI3]MCR4266277.1 DUF1127 domain-containing protein [Nitratireductor sp. ZSWI3]
MRGACGPSAPRRADGRLLGTALVAMVRYIDGRMRKRRSRRQLLDLTEEQLRDIGISRSQALREGWRPFWD